VSTGQTPNAAKFGRALTKSVLYIGFSNISTPVGRGKLDKSSPKLRKTATTKQYLVLCQILLRSVKRCTRIVLLFFYLLVNIGAPGPPRAKVHQSRPSLSICKILSCSGNLCARHARVLCSELQTFLWKAVFSINAARDIMLSA